LPGHTLRNVSANGSMKMKGWMAAWEWKGEWQHEYVRVNGSMRMKGWMAAWKWKGAWMSAWECKGVWQHENENVHEWQHENSSFNGGIGIWRKMRGSNSVGRKCLYSWISAANK
jgi:hypothetical protein